MLLTVLIVMILLMLLPLLAEVRMVIRAILAGSIGARNSRELLKGQPFAVRLTLSGLDGHLRSLHREYGQYLRLQWAVLAAAGLAILLTIIFVALRWAVSAVIVCVFFGVAAFAGISLVHAHAGYDPDKHTTRYNRTEK